MRTSFILHLDSLDILDELSNEEAGLLLKAIRDFNRDEEPSLLGLMKVVFLPFKNQFIRDEVKWGDKKEGKSKSGRLGNLKRYNPDLYKQVIDNEIDIEESEFIAKGRKCENSDNLRPQKVADHRLKVSVSDSVSKKESVSGSNATSDFMDYEKFLLFWNESAKSTKVKKIIKITEKRKMAIRTILKTYTKDDIKEAVYKLTKSKFANGENNHGWVATFDWLFVLSNFTKALEGNYDNKSTINDKAIY